LKLSHCFLAHKVQDMFGIVCFWIWWFHLSYKSIRFMLV